MINKGIVLIVVLFFVGIIINPSTANIESSDDIENVIVRLNIDPISKGESGTVDSNWPMYQHDAANTGFSSSYLPDSLNLLYNLTYQDILNSSFFSPYSSPIVTSCYFDNNSAIRGNGAALVIIAQLLSFQLAGATSHDYIS